jgi:hypothetical protein
MTTERHEHLTTQPCILKLGSHYVGARIEGSLQVLGTASCERYYSRE